MNDIAEVERAVTRAAWRMVAATCGVVVAFVVVIFVVATAAGSLL